MVDVSGLSEICIGSIILQGGCSEHVIIYRIQRQSGCYGQLGPLGLLCSSCLTRDISRLESITLTSFGCLPLRLQHFTLLSQR